MFGEGLSDARVEKWVRIMENWVGLERTKPGYIDYQLQWEGIPDEVRGRMWMVLAMAGDLEMRNEGLFEKLLTVEKVVQEDAISRDIKRTFSKHQYFADATSLGQLELVHVLRAYAAYDEEVGYCQGMGFLSAVLLCYMPAEKAFWTLVSLMQQPKFEMRQLFRPGMPKFRPLMQTFSKLLEQTIPALHAHFLQLGVEPGMYASQWFMTLFSYNFPLAFVARVWDLFLVKGWTIIYRVALALLANGEGKLLKNSFENVMIHLRDIPKHVKVDDVFPRALLFEINIPLT